MTVEEIKDVIRTLPAEDRDELASWLSEQRPPAVPPRPRRTKPSKRKFSAANRSTTKTGTASSPWTRTASTTCSPAYAMDEKVEFHPLVELDVSEAADWYEVEVFGLGERFEDEAKHLLHHLPTHARHHAVRFRDVPGPTFPPSPTGCSTSSTRKRLRPASWSSPSFTAPANVKPSSPTVADATSRRSPFPS